MPLLSSCCSDLVVQIQVLWVTWEYLKYANGFHNYSFLRTPSQLQNWTQISNPKPHRSTAPQLPCRSKDRVNTKMFSPCVTKGRAAFETPAPFLSSSWKTGKNNQLHREICHWAFSVILLSDQLVFMSESFSFPEHRVQVQTSAVLSQKWSISLLRHQHISLMNSQQGKWALNRSCPATHAQFDNWNKDVATGATGVAWPIARALPFGCFLLNSTQGDHKLHRCFCLIPLPNFVPKVTIHQD